MLICKEIMLICDEVTLFCEEVMLISEGVTLSGEEVTLICFKTLYESLRLISKSCTSDASKMCYRHL